MQPLVVLESDLAQIQVIEMAQSPNSSSGHEHLVTIYGRLSMMVVYESVVMIMTREIHRKPGFSWFFYRFDFNFWMGLPSSTL